MSKIERSTKIFKKIRRMLKANDIRLLLYRKSCANGSIYCKFSNDKLGTLTIRDHDSPDKYNFRWTVRTDMTGISDVKNGKLRKTKYGRDSLRTLVEHITSVDRWLKNNGGNDE